MRVWRSSTFLRFGTMEDVETGECGIGGAQGAHRRRWRCGVATRRKGWKRGEALAPEGRMRLVRREKDLCAGCGDAMGALVVVVVVVVVGEERR
jgi:hypothetical protein